MNASVSPGWGGGGGVLVGLGGAFCKTEGNVYIVASAEFTECFEYFSADSQNDHLNTKGPHFSPFFFPSPFFILLLFSSVPALSFSLFPLLISLELSYPFSNVPTLLFLSLFSSLPSSSRSLPLYVVICSFKVNRYFAKLCYY